METSSVKWQEARSYEDITYHKCEEGLARIAFNRPEVRNAFRPQTIDEMIDAFNDAWADSRIGVILLTGNGHHGARGEAGYIGDDGVARLNVLTLQKIIRSIPKVVIALVPGYAIGGGHVLHVVCDLTIAADNAVFGQTGPKVGSFDAGLGASFLARHVGQKKAREIWYLCRQYGAEEAEAMGMVNKVVPVAELEEEGVIWGKEIMEKSPLAIRFMKVAFNAETDGQIGIQELAGNATMLFYMSEEGQEGRDAYLQKRKPEFRKYPWRP